MSSLRLSHYFDFAMKIFQKGFSFHLDEDQEFNGLVLISSLFAIVVIHPGEM